MSPRALGRQMTLEELREWDAHFVLEDFRRDYRTACFVWTQTDGKRSPYQIMENLFPEYRAPEKPTPWSDDDQARFEAWYANVNKRLNLDNGHST